MLFLIKFMIGSCLKLNISVLLLYKTSIHSVNCLFVIRIKAYQYMLQLPCSQGLQIYKFGVQLQGADKVYWERIPHCSSECIWNRMDYVNTGCSFCNCSFIMLSVRRRLLLWKIGRNRLNLYLNLTF